MTISKRSLIFVFAVTTAFSCFAHDHKLAAQDYQGLDMPEVFYMTPKPYESLVGRPTRAEKKLISDWKKENGSARSAINAGQSKVKGVLESGGDVTANAEARKFLEDYTFPSMTQTDADTLSTLGEKRSEFLKNYLNGNISGAARGRMLDFTIDKLQGYSADATLHPSARVNAIVLLSQLTERPLARSQAPIVSAKALKGLLNIFSGTDPKQNPDFVRVAALSGIRHQLELNLKSGQAVDSSVKGQLVDAAMEFMAAPADRDQDAAAYWNKRQAVQLSASLKDAKTLPALLAILNDETSSLELKLDVVRTIVKTGAMGSDPKAVLVAICKFASAAVGNESTRLQDQIKRMERDNILFANRDIKEEGIDFQPADPDDVGGNQNNFDDLGDGRGNTAALVELPNFQLQNTRNRLRAVALFCQQAIGASKQDGLRPNLDSKAETLAGSTVRQLNSLLNKANVGLIALDERRRSGEPTPQEEDQQRRSSYVDQMVRVCDSAQEALTKQLSNYTAE